MGHLVKIFQERMERRRIIRENKDLCERYPFLIPWNRWSGDPVSDYEYRYTELDNMPEGWRRAFGLRMCEDLRNALIDDNDLDRWRIVQLKEKYGCYDSETEVLTKEGWKFFNDVTFDDEFATLDHDGETLIYQKPTDIIKEPYRGRMYHLENRGINFLVTENHNMYVAKGSYYYHEKNNTKIKYPFEFALPEKYFGKDKRFKKGATWIGDNPYGDVFEIPGYEYKNYMAINDCERVYNHDSYKVNLVNWLKFLGFYVAEGYTSSSEKKYGAETLIAYNTYDEEGLVCELLDGIGVNYKQAGDTKRFGNTVIGRWLLDNCGHLAPNKKVPDFIKTLPPDLIKIFLEYLYIGDGHKNTTSNILTTTSKQLCDDVCELLIKAGYSFRYRIREPRDNHKPWHKIHVVGKLVSYEINWLQLTEVEIDNSKHSSSFIERFEDYDGMVYCVTIPSHILYVRRGGKGAWCGNSLRLYDNAHKKDSQVPFIINKYEDLSMRTCIQCGAPATRMTTGWISPYCDKCCPSLDSVPIDEYFKEDETIG